MRERGVGDWPLWNGLDEQRWLVRSENDTFLLEKIFFQSFGFSDFWKVEPENDFQRFLTYNEKTENFLLLA